MAQLDSKSRQFEGIADSEDCLESAPTDVASAMATHEVPL